MRYDVILDLATYHHDVRRVVMRGIHLATLLCLLLAPGVVLAAEKLSAFSAVRWEGDTPIVRVEGKWYELGSIDDRPAVEIVSYCKKFGQGRWKNRFSEDLVEVYKSFGMTIGPTVKLLLIEDGKEVVKTVTMTEDLWDQALDYNRDPSSGEGPSASVSSREAPPPAGVSGGGAALAGKPDWLFGFEAATITFEFSGDILGTETIHVQDRGKVIVVDNNTGSGTFRTHLTHIWNEHEGKGATINHKSKLVIPTKARTSGTRMSVSHATEESLAATGFVRLADAEVAGRTCAVYENRGEGDSLIRSYRWKGLELKIETENVMGMSYTKTATSIEEGAPIPESALAYPEGYTVFGQ